MRKKALFLTVFVFCVISVGTSQAEPKIMGKYSDIGENLSAFAKHNAGRLNMTADMGGNWSEAYIGELIHFPPHWGVGLSFALNAIREEQLNNLVIDTLGLGKIDPLFTDKIFFPTYLFELRLGGFRDIPFDLGLKFGALPKLVPIPLFGSFVYDNLQIGGDIRYSVIQTYTGFKFSIGVGVNYLTGYIEQEGYNVNWTDGGQGGAQTNAMEPAGDVLRIVWNTLSFNAKLIIQKKFPVSGFSLYGGLVAGAGFTQTGIAIIGEHFKYDGQIINDMRGSDLRNVETSMSSKIGNNSDWKIGNNGGVIGLTGTIPITALDLHSYQGIAFEFNNDTYLQLALVFDFMSLEYGVTLGFRWQQRHY